MKELSKNTSTLLFILLTGVLVVIAFTSYNKIRQFNKSVDLVMDTQIVKANIIELRSIVTDAESGQRGFLITNDSVFLQSVVGAEQRSNLVFSKLESLISDNVGQKENLKKLKTLLAERYLLLNKTLESFKNSPSANLPTDSLLLESKNKMDEVSNKIALMLQTEDVLLEQRIQVKDRKATLTPIFLLLLSLFSIVALTLFFFRLRKETNSRVSATKLVEVEAEARKQIEASELFNRTVLESSPDCLKVLDNEGRIQYMNFNGLCQMEIDDFSTFKNKNWWTIWGSENEALVKASLDKAITGKIAQFIAYCPTAKGTPKWWDVLVSPVGKAGEPVQQIISVSRDITEQKKSEEAIEKIAAHLTLATDSANVGTWSFNVQKQELEWSAVHKKMWGYDAHRTDLTYEDWHKLILPEDKEKTFEKIDEAKNIHNSYDVEYCINRANDDAVRCIRSVGKYYYNEKGEAETLTGISVDITQQKESELKLKASEEKYRGIFEAMDQGFSIIEMIFDSDNKPVDCVYIETNPVFEKQTGLKNVTGKTVRELIPNLEEEWFQIYGKVALTGEPNRFIEGSEALGRWFETYAFRLGDQGSKKVAVLFTDITERKQNEETLQYRKALLEAHNEANRDGLLLVDAKGKIISYNQSFIDVWRMPKEIVDAKDDELALAFAMAQLVNPQQFIDKVKWLYEHPSETSIDELEYLDGRIIERHGYSVVGEDGTYYAWSWTFRDITEQKAAAEAIKESETRFRTMAEATEVLIGVADEASNVTYFNKAWVDLTGRPMEDLLKLGWADLLHPEDKDRVVDTYLSAFANQEGYELEFRILNKNGEYSWLLAKIPARFHPDGTFAGYISASIDITDRKEAEEKIKDARELLETTFQNVPSAIYNFDKTGKILYLNEIGANQIGYATTEEVLAEKDALQLRKRAYETFTVLNEQGQPMPVDQHSTALTFKTGKSSEVVSQLINKKTGASLWLLSRASPIYDASDQLVKVLSTSTDITLQKVAAEAIKESEVKFRVLSENVPHMIWTATADGKRNFFNKHTLDYTGLTHAELEDDGWQQPIFHEDIENDVSKWHHAVATGEDLRAEKRLRRHDGSFRWHLCHSIAQKGSNGSIKGWIGTCTDITEHKAFTEELEIKVNQRTTELKKTNEELKHTNTQLGQFAHITSHDLQEPLRKIITFSKRLQDEYQEELTTGAKTYLDKIEAASDRMRNLIQDLLNYSRLLEHEKSVENTNLNETLKNILTDFELLVDEKKAEIKSDALPTIEAIPLQMNQLFYNLIGNALKFSREEVPPVITITSRTLSEKDVKKYPTLNPSSSYVEIIFKDNGIGFEQQYSEKIFTIFQRLHNRDTFVGTGIGLALTKKITENHNGLTFAAGQEHIGASFHVILPFTQPQ